MAKPLGVSQSSVDRYERNTARLLFPPVFLPSFHKTFLTGYITDAVMDLQGCESSALPALRKQFEYAERGITNILNAIQAGIINASAKQRLDDLENAR